MKISKKKTMFTRLVTAMLSAVMLVIVFSFSAVSAMAMAADAPETATVAELPAVKTAAFIPLGSLKTVTPESAVLSEKAIEMPQVIMLATDLDSKTDGDDQFESVVRFFVKWIKRVGLLVAFVGGVMFFLAMKNNDADQKQAGLLTLVAGFGVAALCQAVDMFDIFS